MLAQHTPCASVGVRHPWQKIAFFVQFICGFKDILWAEPNAEHASFAEIFLQFDADFHNRALTEAVNHFTVANC